MYENDLSLIDLQWSICHKTKPNQNKSNFKLYLITRLQFWRSGEVEGTPLFLVFQLGSGMVVPARVLLTGQIDFSEIIPI